MAEMPPPARPTVFIATPCYGGLVSQEYTLSLLALSTYNTRVGLEIVVALQGHDSLVTRSRNTLVGHFLDSNATHLLFIDADIGFEPSQVERMVAFDEDVVCGIYPLKVRDWGPMSLDQMKLGVAAETASLRYVGLACDANEFEQRGDFVTGQYAGCGFMLIKRGAIERMITAFPETAYRAIHSYSNAKPRSGYTLFETEIDHQDGLYLSEDFAFCRRFRSIGGKIWLDTQGKLTHVGSHAFVGEPSIGFPLPRAPGQSANAAA